MSQSEAKAIVFNVDERWLDYMAHHERSNLKPFTSPAEARDVFALGAFSVITWLTGIAETPSYDDVMRTGKELLDRLIERGLVGEQVKKISELIDKAVLGFAEQLAAVETTPIEFKKESSADPLWDLRVATLATGTRCCIRKHKILTDKCEWWIELVSDGTSTVAKAVATKEEALNGIVSWLSEHMEELGA